MPYRDELVQAHARIESLEAELRAERERTGALEPGVAGRAAPRIKPAALLAAIGFVAGAFLAFYGVRQNPKAVLKLSVEAVVNNEDTYRGERLKVEGEVAPGKTAIRKTPCATTLVMERRGVSLPVVYEGCILPDLYRDGSEIVVDGKLGSDGIFRAHDLAVRVPSF